MELSIVVLKKMSKSCQSDKTPLPTIVRAKSFLSPCYIMFYLSTTPIYLFTSYSSFLCSKSSYSILHVIGKKDLSLTPQSWQTGTQQNHFFSHVEEKTRQSLLTWHSCNTILLVEFLIDWQKQVKEEPVECITE